MTWISGTCRVIGSRGPRPLRSVEQPGGMPGLKAAERSIELLVGENLDVLIYPLSDGKDPCDAIAESGGDAFWESVKTDSVDIFDFKWNRTIETAEAAASPQMLSRGVKDFLSLVAKISDKVARRVVLNKYVERFEILGIAMEDLPLEEMGLFSPEREREEVQQQEPVLNEGRITLLESILFVMISAPGQAEAITGVGLCGGEPLDEGAVRIGERA